MSQDRIIQAGHPSSETGSVANPNPQRRHLTKSLATDRLVHEVVDEVHAPGERENVVGKQDHGKIIG